MADPNNLLFHDQKMVGMFICKAGNTSVRHALTDALGCKRRLDLTLPTCPTKAVQKFKKQYWVFGFIRNPFGRVASCYANKVASDPYHRPFTRKYGDRVYKGMPFSEWVDFICSTPDVAADQHFRSMSYDLCLDGEILPHALYRIEDSEWWEKFRQDLFNHCGLDIGPERHKNRSRLRPRWTPELRAKVRERYAADFRTFGYE